MADEQNTQPEEDTGKKEAVKAPSRPPVLRQGVHYVASDYSHLPDGQKEGEHLGATIVDIHEDEAVTLQGAGFFASPVAHDESGTPGTWHWPEPEKES